MEALHIDLLENGYSLYDQEENDYVFEGIKDFDLAWELYELLLGEKEADEPIHPAVMSLGGFGQGVEVATAQAA
ncbi:MAG: hypothetical protein HQL52_09925 [Magnetococcales bacterium]|nr:hypothetical protein [Magnetococcales bacterium]